jgi:hypothetical protein
MIRGLWKMRDKGCVGWLHKPSQSKDLLFFIIHYLYFFGV